MFSLWPELFAFQLLAVFLLRIVAAYFFLLLGSKLLRAAWGAREQKSWLRAVGVTYGIAQIAVGGFLLIGFYTQPAALAGVILTMLPVGRGHRANKCEQHVQLLLFTISLSLLILGPGALAFDLPI